MALRPPVAFALLAALTLALASGCVANDPATTTGDASGSQDASLEAPAAAVSSHGPAKRVDSDVTVAPGVTPFPGYTARQTVTVTNGLAGFPGARAEYATPGGSLEVHAGPAGGYQAVVELTATGLTESDARAALATMHVDVTDAVESGVLHLAVKGRIDPTGTVGPVLDGGRRSISMAVALDPALAYALAAGTGGGGLEVAGLGGPSVNASSGGGGVDASDLDFAETRLASGGGNVEAHGIVATRLLEVGSGGGGLGVQAAAGSADIGSGGGGVNADLRPLATGTFKVASGGGGVTVALARGDGVAYAVHATSGGGGCDVTLHDGETTGSGSEKSARSAGFDTAPIQATVEASSGGGGVTVHD